MGFIYPINTKLKIKDILHNSSEKYYSVPRIDFGNNNHKKTKRVNNCKLHKIRT